MNFNWLVVVVSGLCLLTALRLFSRTLVKKVVNSDPTVYINIDRMSNTMDLIGGRMLDGVGIKSMSVPEGTNAF